MIGEQKTKLNEDKFYIDVARNLLQDSGIKTKIVKQYLPIMNKLVNTYLSSMDFFVNLILMRTSTKQSSHVFVMSSHMHHSQKVRRCELIWHFYLHGEIHCKDEKLNKYESTNTR